MPDKTDDTEAKVSFRDRARGVGAAIADHVEGARENMGPRIDRLQESAGPAWERTRDRAGRAYEAARPVLGEVVSALAETTAETLENQAEARRSPDSGTPRESGTALLTAVGTKTAAELARRAATRSTGEGQSR